MSLADALRGARVYDLEQPRYAGAPVFPAHEPGVLLHLHRRHEPGMGEARTSASALLVMTEHSGTHIDALCHQAEDLRLHGGAEIGPSVQTPAGASTTWSSPATRARPCSRRTSRAWSSTCTAATRRGWARPARAPARCS